MKVIISVGGRFHAIKLAEQLAAGGYLERIITTKKWYVKKVLSSRQYIVIPLPEYLGAAFRFITPLRRKGYYSYIKDNLFDAAARKYITACDVFHAWGNYALYSIPTARKYGARIVIERGSTHPHFQKKILEEEFEKYGVPIEPAHPQIIEKGLREIEEADKVVIPSEFVKKTFLLNGVPESRLEVIPYGADLTSFRKTGRSDSVFRLLFVGNIGIQKGVHYLLQAWKALKLPNAELVLAGTIEREMRPMLDSFKGSFTYLGHVRHEELPAVYGAASAFVLPSLQEGSALVTYEAMACGLPCIVSENTGSIIRDGIDGFVLPIRDVHALAEKILWCYEHRNEADAVGEAALRTVQEFTWERYAARVVAMYRTLLTPGTVNG
jgi:glycosyltransferase involved in cell wall biosynthesis